MNKQLIEFLDKYGLEGSYSGGGDSGGIDELKTVHDVEDAADLDLINIDDLTEWVYDKTLSEYGGWAWNGDASGSISYNKESKTIEVHGTETDDENQEEVGHEMLDLKEFFSPADIQRVDSVNILFSEWNAPQVRINVLNGPWTESLQEAEDNLLARLEKLHNEWNDNGYKFYADDAFELDTPVRLSKNIVREFSKYWEINLLEEEYIQEGEELNYE